MRTILVALLTGCTVIAVAQTVPGETPSADSMATYVQPPVIVTATRSEQDPSSLGRSVTVFTNAVLAEQPGLGLSGLLSRTPGAYLVGAGQNPGMSQALFLRGANSNQTVIMVDDIRLTDPSSPNNAADLVELSSLHLDRVEIVRGAHSTLYGSSAIGGAVNLITRKSMGQGLRVEAELQSGVFGPHTLMLGQKGVIGYATAEGLSVTGGASRLSVRGMDATVDTVTGAGFKNRDRDDLEKFDYHLRIALAKPDWGFYASYLGVHEEADIDAGAFRDDPNYTVDVRRGLMTFGGSYRPGLQWLVRWVGGVSNLRRDIRNDSSVVDAAGTTDHNYFESANRGTNVSHEVIARYDHDGLLASAGIGRISESMGSSSYFYSSAFGGYESRTNLDTLGLSSTTNSVFLHTHIQGVKLHPSWSWLAVVAGARVNQHSAYGWNATWEINPSARVGDLTVVYGTVSTGFNAPSLYQLYAPSSVGVPGITLGNPRLGPERSTAVEFGVRWGNAPDMTLSVAVFQSEVQNAVEYVYLWDKAIGIDTLGNDFARNDYRGDTYLNLGTLSTKGMEVGITLPLPESFRLEVEVSLLKGELGYDPARVDAGHTEGHHVQVYSNGRFLTGTVTSVGLIRRPSTLTASLAYTPATRWAGRIDVRHAGVRHDNFYDAQLGPFGSLGSVPIDPYTLVDVSAAARVADHVRLAVRCENVFDIDYHEIAGFTTRGRGVYVSLRYVR